MPAALKVDWAAIRLAAVAGRLSYEELAEQFGVEQATIRQRAKREGWTQRAITTGEAVDNVLPKPRFSESEDLGLRGSERRMTTEQAVSRAVTDTWAKRIEESKEGWHRITARGRKAIERMDDDEIVAVVDKAGKLFDMERKNLGLDKEQGNQTNVVIGFLNEGFTDAGEGVFSPSDDLVVEAEVSRTEGEEGECSGIETR